MSIFDTAPKPMAEFRQSIDPEEAYGYEPIDQEQQEDENFLDKMLADMKAKKQRSMLQMQGVR